MDPRDDGSTRRSQAMVERFLSQAGIDDPDLTADAARLLERQIAEIGEAGLRESDLAVMGQAYIRAVGRIVAAEAEALHRVRDAPAGDAGRIRTVGERLLPLGREVFEVLHRLMLERVVADEGAGLDRSRRTRRPAAVAHVDVIASTAFLEVASAVETQRMVDGLFAAAQASIRGRAVEVTKYVGDGVFLVGRDPEAVAAASLDCIAGLAERADLPSRAGLAYGTVIHRAGDVFGLAVNLSHALTKLADASTLLATAVAPAELPEAFGGRPRRVAVKGIDAPIAVRELRGMAEVPLP